MEKKTVQKPTSYSGRSEGVGRQSGRRVHSRVTVIKRLQSGVTATRRVGYNSGVTVIWEKQGTKTKLQ